MSQILFWDTERIRLLYFPQQAGRRLRSNAKSVISEGQSSELIHDVQHLETIGNVRKLIELLVHK
jgi:calcineurin-like phosphoesterase family protein